MSDRQRLGAYSGNLVKPHEDVRWFSTLVNKSLLMRISQTPSTGLVLCSLIFCHSLMAQNFLPLPDNSALVLAVAGEGVQIYESKPNPSHSPETGNCFAVLYFCSMIRGLWSEPRDRFVPSFVPFYLQLLEDPQKHGDRNDNGNICGHGS
jgi:hypothetical protein